MNNHKAPNMSLIESFARAVESSPTLHSSASEMARLKCHALSTRLVAKDLILLSFQRSCM